MKRLFVLFFAALPLTAFAQQPDWYDDAQRSANYPKGQYFTGFSEGQRLSGERLETAMQRLKDAARVEAMSTIRVHVQSETNSNLHTESFETLDNWAEEIRESLDIRTRTKVDVEIPGLQIEAWQNPQNGNIAAFAYVKKSTLIRQLEKKITVGLTKIETSLDQIDQLIASGQKIQARELAERTLPQFIEVDETQKILAAVDDRADEESLQLQETRNLRHRLTGIIADLKHGINIYLMCKADIFGSTYSALKGEIQGELSKMGCTFVPSADKSDWAIYVTAKAREYNAANFGSTTTYFAYVDVEIVVEKTTTGQRIFEDAFSEKGGHTHNFEQAARQAYKDISPKISKIVKEQIQQ